MEPPNKLIKMSEANQPIASNAESDVNIPPAQDSPKNIVNILNDDCIQAILRKLDNAVDFLNAANVCTRFQYNAKMCFQHKDIVLKNCSPEVAHSTSQNNEVPFELADSFLKIFGQKIRSIYSWTKKSCNEHINLIPKYCAKTLVELEVNNGRKSIFDACDMKIELPFKALQKLVLHSCSISNHCSEYIFPELTHLTLSNPSNVNGEWLENRFPKLQHVVHHDLGCSAINEKLFNFQWLNPQIRSYELCTIDLKSSPWKHIAQRLPNIDTLKCQFKEPDIRYIREFRFLKDLNLSIQYDLNPVKSLMMNYIMGHPPIQKLELYSIDFVLLDLLQQLNTIKELTVKYLVDELAVDIVRMLPTLECLIVRSNSMSTVPEMVQQASSTLRMLIVRYYDCETFDLSVYNSIEELATDRIRVNIQIARGFEHLVKKIGNTKCQWVTLSKWR